MTTTSVPERAGELRRARVPFVHARVVLAERPTSAKPGDEALVLGDGTIEGFVGGACAESTVRAQALALLDSQEALLLRICPVPEGDQPGKLVVHNPCLSGGTLEIFLEPVVPAPSTRRHRRRPRRRARCAALAERMGYDVTRGGPGPAGARRRRAVVVASHGRDEEPALLAALRAGVPYVGLVASRKRGEAVVASLDCCGSMKSRMHTPAGLDIGARTAEEVAISILAEIVAERPRVSGRPVPESAPPAGTGHRPRVRHDGRHGRLVAAHRPRRRAVVVLRQRLPPGIRRRPTAVSPIVTGPDGSPGLATEARTPSRRRHHAAAARRGRLPRRRRGWPRRCSAPFACRSPCCWRARPASARPRPPRPWPGCWRRRSCGCSATRASTPPRRSTSGTTPAAARHPARRVQRRRHVGHRCVRSGVPRGASRC
jgi:xanthine dehydrogenase accessory factor